MQELEKISANSPLANEMLLYAAKQLETDKLYYLFRSYLNTEDSDEKFLLQADLEGVTPSSGAATNVSVALNVFIGL